MADTPEQGGEGDLPDPLVPAHVDLRGAEPPWALFVDMAVAQFGVSREEAQAHSDELRRQYWREQAGG